MIGDSERPLKITKKKFKKKTSNEEKATRTASAKDSELDQGVGNIIEQFQGFDSKRMEDKYQKKLKTNNNTEIAEEFRNGSQETFGEIKQRLSVKTGDDFTSPKQKKRRFASEIFSYLREKKEQRAVKKEDFESRKRAEAATKGVL